MLTLGALLLAAGVWLAIDTWVWAWRPSRLKKGRLVLASAALLVGTICAAWRPPTRLRPEAPPAPRLENLEPATAPLAPAATAPLAPDAPAEDGAGDDAKLVGIALAPRGDAGVAWSVRNIRSLDGTRVFLPGTDNVAAVAMAADRTVYAIRGRRRFGVAAPHAAAVWRDLPVSGTTKGLAVIANHVAWFAATPTGDVLALTADRGRHWTVQKLPDEVNNGRLRLLARGGLELFGYVQNCHSGDYSIRYRGRIGSNRWRLTSRAAETEYSGPSHFGYADPDDDRPFTGADAYLLGEGQPRSFWIDTRDWLVSFREGEGERVLSEQLPDGLSLITVDPQGRPLGVTKNNVWRWEAAKGWRALDVGR